MLVYSDQRLVEPRRRGPRRDLLDEPPQQLHRSRLAADRQYRHRRGLAVPARAARLCASLPARPRAFPTTITGWRWSRWPPARSPTWTGRSTTTSSTRTAALGPRPRQRPGERARRPGCSGSAIGQRPCVGWRSTYFLDAAGWLLARRSCCFAAATPERPAKRRSARALRREPSAPAARWRGCCCAPPARWLGQNETLGAERRLATGIVWRHLLRRCWSPGVTAHGRWLTQDASLPEGYRAGRGLPGGWSASRDTSPPDERASTRPRRRRPHGQGRPTPSSACRRSPPAPVAIEVRDLSKTFQLPLTGSTRSRSGSCTRSRRPESASCARFATSPSTSSRGEFFGIVGRNGSGKSTLLKILASIYRADAGTIRMAGRVAPFIELGVGFNPDLTARENVILNGVMMGLTRERGRGAGSTR